ncbi:hypothetical protein OMP38_30140 [Cohnella ginsengisoli]|uniref:Uncharacterized protein n=1 Tax=Cohnella ginsengisoli TaxID=425004 RepID=A0A9X4QPQ7_9BACL|nr:hypothetical protein [Cohnella ginsengisoli]MDG0794629.1 hypothetical protein [Cohnella ginsengisoli]
MKMIRRPPSFLHNRERHVNEIRPAYEHKENKAGTAVKMPRIQRDEVSLRRIELRLNDFRHNFLPHQPAALARLLVSL